MTKWIFATLVFGIFAVLLTVMYLSSLNDVATEGVHFLSRHTVRRSLTNADNTVIFAVGALVCGVACLGSLGAIFSSRTSDSAPPADNSPTSSGSSAEWSCPSCHEKNPSNFDECWKCLADRPPEDHA